MNVPDMPRGFPAIALLALKAVRSYLWKLSLKDAPCFSVCGRHTDPKFGKKFDGVSILFDHAAHHGKPYKNGHCPMRIALAVPGENMSVAAGVVEHNEPDALERRVYGKIDDLSKEMYAGFVHVIERMDEQTLQLS